MQIFFGLLGLFSWAGLTIYFAYAVYKLAKERAYVEIAIIIACGKYIFTNSEMVSGFCAGLLGG